MASLKEVHSELKEQRKQNTDETEELSSKLEAIRQAIGEAEDAGSEDMDELLSQEAEIVNQLNESNDSLEALKSQTSARGMTFAFVEALQSFLGVDFMEKFQRIADGVKSVGDNIVGKLDSMVVSPVKGLLDGFFDAVKLGIALIGGVIGLQAFLDGWQNAERWFGSNADWGDRIAAGMASIVQTFLGLEDEQAQRLAEGISTFIGGIADVASSFLNMALVLTDVRDGDLSTAVQDFASNIFDNWQSLLGVALLLAPGATIRTAIMGIRFAFMGISAAFSFLSGSGALGAITAILGGVGAAGAGTILGAIAVIVNTVQAFYQSIQAFRETWAETGSFMESLRVAAVEFIAQFLGWPIQLGADLINWVANLLGFDDIIGDFDPVGAIRDFYMNLTGKVIEMGAWLLEEAANLGKFYYNAEEGTVLGINWSQLLTDVRQWFVGTYDNVMERIGAIGRWFYNPETGEVFGINWGQMISDIATTVVNTAMMLPEMIGGMFEELWVNIQNVFFDLMNGIIERVNRIPGIEIEPFERATVTQPEQPPAATPSAAPEASTDLINTLGENSQLTQAEREREMERLGQAIGAQITVAPVSVNNSMANYWNQPMATVTP